MMQVKQTGAGMTLIPDSFIDRHLPDAPGDYVKVYLYLLSLTHRSEVEISLEALAAFFSCEETDILDALEYWEERGLCRVSRVKGEIARLELMPEAKSNIPSRAVSQDRIRTLKAGHEEVRQMLFACEQMLGHTLSGVESSKILYFYDGLKFSDALVEYLIEYCVEKGKTDIRYIEKVALEWHKAKVTTVEDAKLQSGTWGKRYFAVLKSFGITNRNPIEEEIRFIDRWVKEFGFSTEIIAEAAARTLASTGRQSFKYADGILSNWKEAGVKVKADVERLDADRRKKAEAAPKGEKAAKNGFHQFTQHEYNFDEIDKILDKQ